MRLIIQSSNPLHPRTPFLVPGNISHATIIMHAICIRERISDMVTAIAVSSSLHTQHDEAFSLAKESLFVCDGFPKRCGVVEVEVTYLSARAGAKKGETDR